MFSFARTAIFAGMIAGIAMPAWAADLYEPPVEQAPAEPVYEPVNSGGWYIRGDLDYHWAKLDGAPWYTVYGPPGGGSNEFSSYKLRGAPSIGLGVGYQVNDHFRVDLTGDYWFKAKFSGSTSGTCGGGLPCLSAEASKMSAYLLLANAYADLGTWHGVTPYLGAGIGGAHIKWDTVYDPTPGATETNPGAKNWRFAYALMAGASYCLTDHLKLDAGYRFTHIQGGRMFDYDVTSAGPGYDRGMNVHEVRGGLRYQFGNSNCTPPVAYEPTPEPVYTK
jgi:opacity protein-like surface antigen